MLSISVTNTHCSSISREFTLRGSGGGGEREGVKVREQECE